eukprot:1898132-Pyramimonas_sp.AAC.1
MHLAELVSEFGERRIRGQGVASWDRRGPVKDGPVGRQAAIRHRAQEPVVPLLLPLAGLPPPSPRASMLMEPP